VGFAIKNSLSAAIEPPTGGAERILTLYISTRADFVDFLSIYEPTLCSTPKAKDQFYEALDEAISRIPSTKGLIYKETSLLEWEPTAISGTSVLDIMAQAN
jgi:hypothetical protein